MNSNTSGLLPGANPSGTNLVLPFAPQQGGQASLGGTVNPFLPVSTGTSTSLPVLPQGAVSTSATSGMPALLPYQQSGYPVSSLTSSTLAVPGGVGDSTTGVSSTGAGLGFPTGAKGDKQLLHTLNATYGKGLGTILYNFLAGGAGFNQAAVNNLIAAMQPGFEMDQQQLLTDFSAMGNRFGSGAELGLSNLMGKEQLDIGQLESQMYQQAVSDYINVMMGAGGASAQRKLQQQAQGGGGIGGIMSMIPGFAGGASSLISKIFPNADTGILDAIASMGAA